MNIIKTLITGGLLTLLLLVYAAITKQWFHVDNIMLITGAAGCLLALVFTGQLQMVRRQWHTKYEKKTFHRIALLLAAISVPNFVTAVIIYYSLHP
ncbi:hypothetical protein [Alicyclobacillus sp. SO9]|uniref:hypothetical protein n=1 Tax=Alicyclobacillus sp. SO9 TaxID=2665646 RepID=UPI0018E902B5|nr:hypothetical protein [Alicyclobacillus sp. SO9]QQE78298.1 hypothetical protein GI364_20845 [Alicyclobacillus sp. SO9]